MRGGPCLVIMSNAVQQQNGECVALPKRLLLSVEANRGPVVCINQTGPIDWSKFSKTSRFRKTDHRTAAR